MSPVWFAGFMSPSPPMETPSRAAPSLGPSRRPVSAIGTLKSSGVFSARALVLSSIQAARTHSWLLPSLETRLQWRLLVLSAADWDTFFQRTRFLETLGEGKHAACMIICRGEPLAIEETET
eukprot:Gregarina_sp_Pseudo_9__3022@NODE_3228_length_711_cov_1_930060_g2944_i0_p1_GENE_NODE_3228_length_711_cov_1_930060_g2944_i0NODE_3228_length_711_cov_1_930060_g2944_i0_p1_ORF_typecomplete_len122_score49_69_NODE_3228_length_711_cov_1_930060_g2944_i07372